MVKMKVDVANIYKDWLLIVDRSDKNVKGVVVCI